MARNKITLDMIRQVYRLAKDVFEQKSRMKDVVDILENDAGMKRSSAQMYVQASLNMMNGECYKRNISGSAAEYFLTMIYEELGQQALKKALSSVDKHIKYHEGFMHGRKLRKIRGIHQKFSEYI